MLRILVISLRLRTAFMRMTRKVRKSPNGFLGGLPGPDVWKHCFKSLFAKLKSTFLKRVSRVSCLSCLAGITSLSDWFSMTRDPVSSYKLFNLGTSQRANVPSMTIRTIKEKSHLPCVGFSTNRLSTSQDSSERLLAT